MTHTRFFYTTSEADGGGNSELDDMLGITPKVEEKKVEEKVEEKVEVKLDAEGKPIVEETKVEEKTDVVEEIDNVVKLSKEKKVEEKAKEEEKTTEADLDDAALLKALSKKAGKEITSFDDILKEKVVEKTKEQIEDDLQQRENKKVAYALENKIISSKEIESFIEDAKNPQAVAFNKFSADQKELYPELTQSEIEDKFNTVYAVDEDKDSAEYKFGQKQISFIADTIIRQKHSKYLSLEKEYSEFEKTTKEKDDYNKSILAKASNYKNDLDEVSKRIKQIEVQGYKVELDSDIINEFHEELMKPENAERIIAKGYTLEELENGFYNSAKVKYFDRIVGDILDADRLKRQAGQKGVEPQRNISTKPLTKDEVLSDVNNMLGIKN